MKKLELSEISFIENDEKHYVIYGDGFVGRVLRKMMEFLNINVDCFLCSDGYKKEEYMCGLKMYELSEYLNNKDNIRKNNQHILLAVQQEAEKVLEELSKYPDILVNKIKVEDNITVYRFTYKEYFLSYGEKDFSDRYLNLNGIKFINPFLAEEDYNYSFFSEVNDIILPAVYDDLTCASEGPYEIPNVSVDENDVVFDLGSNIGLFSAVISNRCKKIYAFEPGEGAYKYISKLTEIYPNIEVYKYAVGGYTGKTSFFEDAKFLNLSKIGENDCLDEDSNKNMIDITTIDDFVEKNNVERVDYIKADIEGAERDMLRGAMKTIKKFTPKISICEYHLKDDPEVLESLILEANPNYIVEHKYMKIYAYVPK